MKTQKWIALAGIAGMLGLLVMFIVMLWGQPEQQPPPRRATLVPVRNPAPAPLAEAPATPVAKVFTVSSNAAPLDLAAHHNARLDVSWNRSSYPGDDLAELPAGLQEFAGVKFDIQGVIQLLGAEWARRGLRFPEAAEGIPVHRSCRYLYVLHADGGANAPTGATVANLVLHYSDGTTSAIAIQHDVHVKDWWSYNRPPPSDPNTVIGWSGKNRATTMKGTSVRLYLTRFENPQPEKKVETVDYVSAMAAPGPFMAGLTVE